jgi:hypothetical protein
MQAWIDSTATTVADVAALDAILGTEPPKEVTLVSADGERTLHVSFRGNASGLYWEADADVLLAWGSVPPGAPAGQVVEDAYDDPWFAIPDGAESFEITAAQARHAAHEFVRTGERPTNVQWIVKP